MRLVLGKNPLVAQFIADKTGDLFAPAVSMIGIVSDDGRLIGGVALTNWTGYGVELTLAGPVCLSRAVRQAIGDLAYGWLGCTRLAVTTRRSNRQVRRLAPKLGFVFEGRARGYYGDSDGLVYSLLRDEAMKRGHWTPREKGYADVGTEAA